MNLKNTIEDILLKISSLEVTSIRALFSLVASPEAEPFLHGISESTGNIETLEQVKVKHFIQIFLFCCCSASLLLINHSIIFVVE